MLGELCGDGGGRKEGEANHRSEPALLETLLQSVSRNAAWDSILHNLSLHNTPMQPTKQ
jgi:hypothetical protein